MNPLENTDVPSAEEEKEYERNFTSTPEPHNFVDLKMLNVGNKKLGGLIGLLCADAVGVPYEFHSAADIPEKASIEMTPPASFNRSHKQVPVGTWSDDGAQALCLVTAIEQNEKLDIHDFARRLCNWYEDGYLAVDGEIFDVGIQTSVAIDRLLSGSDPHQSGNTNEVSNGNGSLMRVLPLALYSRGDDQSLVRDAHLQSLPTHAHPRSMVACAYYCLVARAYLNELDSPWEIATTRLTNIYSSWHITEERPRFLNELTLILDSPLREHPTGSGYVVDTLWSAKKALEESSYEDVIKAAIAFGKDTDTTACVAGGLAGMRFGLEGMPDRWLSQLRGFEILSPYLVNL